jgi:hypothetical protein
VGLVAELLVGDLAGERERRQAEDGGRRKAAGESSDRERGAAVSNRIQRSGSRRERVVVRWMAALPTYASARPSPRIQALASLSPACGGSSIASLTPTPSEVSPTNSGRRAYT